MKKSEFKKLITEALDRNNARRERRIKFYQKRYSDERCSEDLRKAADERIIKAAINDFAKELLSEL